MIKAPFDSMFAFNSELSESEGVDSQICIKPERLSQR